MFIFKFSADKEKDEELMPEPRSSHKHKSQKGGRDRGGSSSQKRGRDSGGGQKRGKDSGAGQKRGRDSSSGKSKSPQKKKSKR